MGFIRFACIYFQRYIEVRPEASKLLFDFTDIFAPMLLFVETGVSSSRRVSPRVNGALYLQLTLFC